MYYMDAQVPFPGDTVAECLARRIRGGPVPITNLNPTLSPRLGQVLDKPLVAPSRGSLPDGRRDRPCARPWPTVRPTSHRFGNLPAGGGRRIGARVRANGSRGTAVFPGREPPRPSSIPWFRPGSILGGDPV